MGSPGLCAGDSKVFHGPCDSLVERTNFRCYFRQLLLLYYVFAPGPQIVFVYPVSLRLGKQHKLPLRFTVKSIVLTFVCCDSDYPFVDYLLNLAIFIVFSLDEHNRLVFTNCILAYPLTLSNRCKG